MYRLRVLLPIAMAAMLLGCTSLAPNILPLQDPPVAQGGNGIVVAQVCIPLLLAPPSLRIGTIEYMGQWNYGYGDRARRYSTVSKQPVYENHALHLSGLSTIKAFVVTLGPDQFLYRPPSSLPASGWTGWRAPFSQEGREVGERDKFLYKRQHGLLAFSFQPNTIYPLIRYRWALPTDQMPGQTFPPSPDDTAPVPSC